MNEQRGPGTDDSAGRREVNSTIAELERDLRNYTGRCPFAIDADGRPCGERVRGNRHIVPEANVLAGLRDGRDYILELQWGISQWRELIFSDNPEERARDAATFEPSKKTTADACTGRFACKEPPDHDGEYEPIDVAQPDFDNPEVCLLTYLRLTQFWADQIRLALELHAKWTVRRNPVGHQRKRWDMEGYKQREARRRVGQTLALLGKDWYARRNGEKFDPDLVSTRVLPFRSKVRIAGSVYYGTHTAHVYVYVFPVRCDLHKMAILHLTSQSEGIREHVTQLEQVARGSDGRDGYGVTVAEKLMTGGWGSLAVSPKSYEKLKDHDRATIRKLIERHSEVGNVL